MDTQERKGKMDCIYTIIDNQKKMTIDHESCNSFLSYSGLPCSVDRVPEDSRMFCIH